jgi:hypothetical protein
VALVAPARLPVVVEATHRALGFPGALAGPLAVFVLFLYRYARQKAGTGDLQALCEGLAANGDDAAIAAVDALLDRLRLDGKARAGAIELWARCTLDAAVAAARSGRTDAALRWADTLPPQDLPRTLRAMHAQCVAAFAAGEGKRWRAREALARLRRPAPDADVEQSLLAVEGTLEVPGKTARRRPSRRRC